MKNRMDLQLFAEDNTETATTAANAAQAAAAATSTEQEPKQAESKVDQPKYTDADVNRLIDQKFAEWQKKQQKAVDEAAKLATMNATQKAEYERDQLKKERDDLKKERDDLKAQATMADMRRTAKNMLAEKEISNVPDEILKALVSTDADTTKKAVDSFAEHYKKAVEAAVNDRLRGTTPTVGTGRSNSPVSEFEKRLKKYE